MKKRYPIALKLQYFNYFSYSIRKGIESRAIAIMNIRNWNNTGNKIRQLSNGVRDLDRMEKNKQWNRFYGCFLPDIPMVVDRAFLVREKQ